MQEAVGKVLEAREAAKGSSAGMIRENAAQLQEQGLYHFEIGSENIAVIMNNFTNLSSDEYKMSKKAFVDVISNKGADIHVREMAAYALRLFADKGVYDTLAKVATSTNASETLPADSRLPEQIRGMNLADITEYSLQYQLANALLKYTPGGVISVNNDNQAIIIYSDALAESKALQELLRLSVNDTRKFYLVHKEESVSAEQFLAGLGIDKDIFERHIFHQNSMTADQLALTIASTLHNNNIKQGRVFASTEEDLAAWSKQGLIEALVMLLKDKRFEIVSDYSQKHSEYIKAYEQILIAA